MINYFCIIYNIDGTDNLTKSAASSINPLDNIIDSSDSLHFASNIHECKNNHMYIIIC